MLRNLGETSFSLCVCVYFMWYITPCEVSVTYFMDAHYVM